MTLAPSSSSLDHLCRQLDICIVAPRKISHTKQLPKPLGAGGGAFGARRGAAIDDGKIISAVKSPDIAKLDAPTEEMVRQNVFKPDASGKTNLTKEATPFNDQLVSVAGQPVINYKKRHFRHSKPG